MSEWPSGSGTGMQNRDKEERDSSNGSSILPSDSMTMNVHETLLAEHLEQGYIETGRRGERIDIANPKDTCLHKMRGWTEQIYDYQTHTISPLVRVHHGFCLLTLGHRGRHSTIVYFCDICDMARRGSPAYHDENMSACFMCMGGPQNNRRRRLKREVVA